MIRSISLILAIGLSLAVTETYEQVSENGYLLAFLLFALPLVATIVVLLSKHTAARISIAVTVILFSWLIALLGMSWLYHVRLVTGNLILVDEILAVLPPIIFLVVLWWFTSPIGNKISWVLHRLRFDVLMLLLIVLFILGIQEVEESTGDFGFVWIAILLLFYALAPLYFLIILPTSRIKEGVVKNAITQVASNAGIKKPNIYILHTHYKILNAMAYGLLFQRKFVLFSDKLLRDLTQNEVIAVARHEFAHHKFMHTTFLWLTFVCVMLWVFYFTEVAGVELHFLALKSTKWIGAIIAFVLVSRQFEKQADTYAVVDFARTSGSDIVTEDAANSMAKALQAIAFLNGHSPQRRDYLHGSISKRQQYLRSLVGFPILKIPINTRVRFIKIGILSLLVLRFIV